MMYCLSILSNSNVSSSPGESIFMATFGEFVLFVFDRGLPHRYV